MGDSCPVQPFDGPIGTAEHRQPFRDLWNPLRKAGESGWFRQKYRIALDEIAGMPKKLMQQGKSMEGQPAISELIMNAALDNISEEVLLRSPEESYERLYGYGNAGVGSTASSSQVIRDWQNDRNRTVGNCC